MKNIFIGGTGRSGTTITLNAFSHHPQLYAIPIETKFLVEIDGFFDLYESLGSNYSTAVTPIIVERFEYLMREKVTGNTESSFTEQARLSPSLFDHYHSALDEFMETVRYRHYHPDRVSMLLAIRKFVDSTFGRLARISNKIGWVEKTPANFWRLDFLRQVCPDSYFIHCIRDPRKVLASLMQKGWIHPDPLAAAMNFQGILAALIDKRRTMLHSPRVMEIRLEDLENNLRIEGVMNDLAQQLEIDLFTKFQVESVAEKIAIYHKNKSAKNEYILFTAESAQIVNQILLPGILELGYSAKFPEELLISTSDMSHERDMFDSDNTN